MSLMISDSRFQFVQKEMGVSQQRAGRIDIVAFLSIFDIHPDGYCWILLRWIRSKNIGCRALLNKVSRRCRFRRLFTKSWSWSIGGWRTEWRRRSAYPQSSTASRSRRTTRPRNAASKPRRKHSWWLPGFVFIYLQTEEKYDNFVSFSVQKMLEKELHPLAEKWSKVKLEHTSTYGIRWHKPQITFECINFHQIVKTIHERVLVDFSRGQIYHPCDLRHPERGPGREGGLAPVH